MWLFRGAQSAVFYYATCTPCDAYFSLRKRKKEAVKTSKDTIVTEQPQPVFHQANPFSTNIYWNEEISLGPGPPSRRGHRNGGSRAGSQRNLVSPSKTADSTTMAGASTDANTASRKERDKSRNAVGDRWNRIRYQREDEELWGVGIKGSSVGLSGRGRANTNTSSSSNYCIGRYPEVNDLHPPIVCGPRNRDETRWMLQPPPSAKVMEGKIRSDPAARCSGDTSPHTHKRRRLPLSFDEGPAEENEDECMFPPDIQANSRVPSTATRKPRSSQPPIVISNDRSSTPPGESNNNHPRKRTPLVMIASTAVSTSHVKEAHPDRYLNPSSQLNSRSNSPAPFSGNERSSHASPSSRLTSKPATDASKAVQLLAPDRVWVPDMDVKQVCGIQLELDSNDSDTTDDFGGGGLNVPHPPFRWSMDI